MRILPCIVLLFLTGLISQSAEVFQLGPKNFEERPRGKEADGIVGDFVLRTDKIEAVISGDLPLRRANMGAYYGDGNHTPGCLYDLTRRGENNDQLTVFSPGVQKGDVTHVRSLPLEDGGKTAVVETYVSAATSGRDVAITHHYRATDGADGILIITALHNTGSAPIRQNIKDHWTQMRVQGSVKGIRWADSIDPADKCGYAIVFVEEQGAVNADSRIVGRENGRLDAEIAPGETLKIARFVALGSSPAEAVGLAAKKRNPMSVVPVEWNLATTDQTSPGRASLVFIQQGGQSPAAYPNGDGKISLNWFLGSHPVEVRDIGRETIQETLKLDLGKSASRTDRLSNLSRVSFSITSGGADTPCKVQFHPRNGTAAVNLGPTDRAHGCKDQWHSATGKFEVPLPPGEYQIVVTRGPEFNRLAQSLTLEPGGKVEVTGELRRVIDSPGWVSTDFHNHSTPSGDNVCGTDDRLINLAAEHIEFAPTTEHNRLYDWEPHLKRLNLDNFVKTVPGMELTGRGAHLNCFPLRPDPKLQDGGAPVWNQDPRINALSLQNWQNGDPDRWVHLNHPNMSENFVDRDLDGVADGGFAYFGKFLNGLETQNYRMTHILRKAPFSIVPAKTGLGKQVQFYREFIWLQLLNQGLRVWGVGVADAHHVYGNGVGSWRTYVPSGSDNPAEIDWREISKNARSGRMILSSGPYLEVNTEKGTIAGGEEKAANGEVKLKIRVQCPDWMGMDRVQILVNSRQDPNFNFTAKTHPGKFKKGVVRFDETVTIPLKEDTHLIVAAIGERSDLSPLFGTSNQKTVRPCAYNNPIFIDIDGNGFQPNGDTLDYELPTGKLSVQKAEQLLGK